LGSSTIVAQADASLDAQITSFSNVGLNLVKGRSKEELLESFGEDEFINDPYALLFFMYGNEVESEPWGRYFSDQVWNFDLESIVDDTSYSHILLRLAVISGTDHLLSDVSGSLDWDNQKVSISYKLGEFERSLKPKFETDWADEETVKQFIADIVATTNDGKQFWAADNGQAAILVYLNDEGAAKLNALSDGLISPWQ
jgi:hypothetical protein